LACGAILLAAVSVVCPRALAGPIYTSSFAIFTQNGAYANDPSVDLPFEFTGDGTSVEFTFYNLSTVKCSITSIYFDDGSLLGLSSLAESSGVDFDVPASPSNLPSGNELAPPFVTTLNFSASSAPPPFHNGINSSPAGEWLTITFELTGTATVDDVYDELMNERLRIGAHIQGFPDGSSESAINIPPPIPEPLTVSLVALGALLVARGRRSAPRA
jgi:hypothetical protein